MNDLKFNHGRIRCGRLDEARSAWGSGSDGFLPLPAHRHLVVTDGAISGRPAFRGPLRGQRRPIPGRLPHSDSGAFCIWDRTGQPFHVSSIIALLEHVSKGITPVALTGATL